MKIVRTRRWGNGFGAVLSRTTYIASAEFCLRNRPNGGSAILLRSGLIATIAYLIAIGVRSYTAPEAVFAFSILQFKAEVHQTLPWLGAVFAGVYVALYTRFAAQWQYLACLYNQIMATCIASPPPRWSGQQSNLDAWHAAFVEDAEALHLATKPMFATIIRGVLDQQAVCAAYSASVADGDVRLKALKKAVRRSIWEDRIRRKREGVLSCLRRYLAHACWGW